MMQSYRLSLPAAVALAALLTGCFGGGGGGGGGTSLVRPDRPPVHAHANPNRVTVAGGAPVTVGVTDTGARISHDEFATVIAGTYNVLTANADVTDNNGHGSGVASIIGGKNVGYSGNANLLVVKISDDGNATMDDLARGVEYAALNGAKVINTSYSGWEFFDKATVLPRLNSVVANDSVWVLAAGNGNVNLSSSALTLPESGAVATLLTASGQAIGAQTLIVGALDETGAALRATSNYPGERADIQARFLAAPGTGLDAAGNGSDSGYQSFTGTSAAAPVVSAAAASIRSKWPHLSAEDTANLLLTTANRTHALYSQNNCGATLDLNCGYFTFGQGILNLTAALTPVGPLAVPASDMVSGPADLIETSGMTVSPAFGDAFSAAEPLGSVAAFDALGRDYGVDMRARISSQRSAVARKGALSHFLRTATSSSSRMSYAGERGGISGLVRFGEDGSPASVLFKLAFGDTEVQAYRFQHGYANPAALPDGFQGLSMMSYNANTGTGQQYEGVSGMGAAQALGAGFSVGFDYWHGSNLGANSDGLSASRSEVALRYQPANWVRLSIGVASQYEKGSTLGTTGAGALGLGDGNAFVSQTFAADLVPTPGMTVFARYETGRMNDVSGTNLIERISEIKASQFALGTTLGNDRLQAALVASMPLRVDSSRAHFNLPIGRTLDGRVITERVSADLSPSGRERSLELALAARAGKRGVVQFNLSRTLEAGHSEDAEPINAVVVSYGTTF